RLRQQRSVGCQRHPDGGGLDRWRGDLDGHPDADGEYRGHHQPHHAGQHRRGGRGRQYRARHHRFQQLRDRHEAADGDDRGGRQRAAGRRDLAGYDHLLGGGEERRHQRSDASHRHTSYAVFGRRRGDLDGHPDADGEYRGHHQPHHAGHRRLHSLPTRRSSDLHRFQQLRDRHEAADGDDRGGRQRAAGRRDLAGYDHLLGGGEERRHQRSDASHRHTSYAVFGRRRGDLDGHPDADGEYRGHHQPHHAGHRRLHSLPTRRSSDLHRFQQLRDRHEAADGDDRGGRQRAAGRRDLAGYDHLLGGGERLRQQRSVGCQRHPDGRSLDRWRGNLDGHPDADGEYRGHHQPHHAGQHRRGGRGRQDPARLPCTPLFRSRHEAADGDDRGGRQRAAGRRDLAGYDHLLGGGERLRQQRSVG